VGASIVIPAERSTSATVEKVAVVGSLAGDVRAAVVATGPSVGATVHVVNEADEASAQRALRGGSVDVVVVDSARLIVDKAIAPDDSSTDAQFVRAVANIVSTANAFAAAHLSAEQAQGLAHPPSVPVTSLQASSKGAVHGTSIIGVIVLFILLQQYSAWTLMGVAEEKSSRVVEVLLATVRPVQLLTGKVLGIGLVAFAQAAAILGFALILAKAVGSDILHGTAPLELVSSLVWLVLGYAFYCWAYAAAGSLAERQDQLQSLSFPLSLPIILGYVTSLIAATTGNASPFFDVLAYLPPTAPFAMPVLVGLGLAKWWEFAIAVILSLGGTYFMAKVATGIYRRAILRTGARVRLKQVVSRTAA
jgi:ABC-2 type transport system permease protein